MKFLQTEVNIFKLWKLKAKNSWEFPGVPVVGTLLSNTGGAEPSLVRELKSIKSLRMVHIKIKNSVKKL